VLGAADDELLDVGARELVLEGERLPLTRLEFEVVRYRRDRAGRAVRRTALPNNVSGAAYEGDGNVVDVVIRALRRKLGAHADRIETLRWIGYRLRAAASRPPRG
jgi:DNA-binding response OmpR family regulator